MRICMQHDLFDPNSSPAPPRPRPRPRRNAQAAQPGWVQEDALAHVPSPSLRLVSLETRPPAAASRRRQRRPFVISPWPLPNMCFAMAPIEHNPAVLCNCAPSSSPFQTGRQGLRDLGCRGYGSGNIAGYELGAAWPCSFGCGWPRMKRTPGSHTLAWSLLPRLSTWCSSPDIDVFFVATA